jgi:hypothetical protein
MTSDEKLVSAQTELRKHGFDVFVDEPPSVAEGGKGVVVPGCPHCRKKLQTMAQFMEHLAVDVLPGILLEREPGVD